jgi:hypothetical protein
VYHQTTAKRYEYPPPSVAPKDLFFILSHHLLGSLVLGSFLSSSLVLGGDGLGLVLLHVHVQGLGDNLWHGDVFELSEVIDRIL